VWILSLVIKNYIFLIETVTDVCQTSYKKRKPPLTALMIIVIYVMTFSRSRHPFRVARRCCPFASQKAIVLELTKPLKLTYRKRGADGRPLRVNAAVVLQLANRTSEEEGPSISGWSQMSLGSGIWEPRWGRTPYCWAGEGQESCEQNHQDSEDVTPSSE
jgi:hypothetical protein